MTSILAFIGFVLAIPGLLLIQLADAIDDKMRLRRIDRELAETWGTK